MTPQILISAIGCRAERANEWAGPLTRTMDEFEINTPIRQSAFLAQCAHESCHFVYVRELWGPTPAQERYEGRADLGNTEPGDGRRFCGRGLIQLTGRANYEAFAQATGMPCVTYPEILEVAENAAKVSGWFWRDVKNLNPLADVEDFRGITRRINGGLNGYDHRLALWVAFRKALGVS